MAISKFVTANTYDLTAFYNWLQAKKAGTFLENLTMELTAAADTGSTLTIASANATLTFITQTTPATSATVKLTGETKERVYNCRGSSSVGGGVRISGAILCTNGIIIRVYTQNSSSTWVTNYFGITVDSSGEVAFFHRDGYINDNTLTGYVGIAYKSTDQKVTALTPTYDSPLTSIAPIVPTTSENDITFPHAFAALHTQQSGLGLAAVSIGTDKYITNGYWYVKD